MTMNFFCYLLKFTTASMYKPLNTRYFLSFLFGNFRHRLDKNFILSKCGRLLFISRFKLSNNDLIISISRPFPPSFPLKSFQFHPPRLLRSLFACSVETMFLRKLCFDVETRQDRYDRTRYTSSRYFLGEKIFSAILKPPIWLLGIERRYFSVFYVNGT